MQDLIIEIMNNFGYIGVFLLITIENVFPPIPSEVILLFGGFMTTYTSMNVIGVIVASTLGSVLGAIILYYIGKILNKERLKKIITSKPGKLLRLKPEDIDKADEWFDTKGNKTVFFCRFIPVIRSLITIAGSIVGENWTSILEIMDNYSHIIVILLAIIFVIAIIIFYSKRRKSNAK